MVIVEWALMTTFFVCNERVALYPNVQIHLIAHRNVQIHLIAHPNVEVTHVLEDEENAIF